MHDIIAFLKGAVAREPNSGLMGCYAVHNGSIYTRNSRLQAGIDYETPVNFNVPAEELENALSRMKQVTDLTFTGDSIVIKGGRNRARIQCYDGEPPALPDTSAMQFFPCPRNLNEALKVAATFRGDTGVYQGIRLWEGRVTAICNTRGVDIDVGDMPCPPVLLAPDCVDFLSGQGAPAEYACDERSVMFRWSDGRWMRSQVMVGELPESVDRIFESVKDQDAPMQISPDLRAAYEDISAMSDGRIMMTPQGFRGVRGSSEVEVEFDTGLPEGHESFWQNKVLDPVIAVAQRFNPLAHPKPALFVGQGLFGCCMGTNR